LRLNFLSDWLPSKIKKAEVHLINKYLNLDKIDLIDSVFRHNEKIKSFADLGGVWRVEAGYTFYALKKYNPEKAYLVDLHFTDIVREQANKFPNLNLIKASFGTEKTAKEISKVDAVILFDVLLHQVNPNWDEVLTNYAQSTNYFIVYNQQFMKPGGTVRLLDLGEEGYFQNVPHDKSHPGYRNIFDKLNEKHPNYVDRNWKDVPDIWQWGITNEDLSAKMYELGFRQIFMRDYGQWDDLQNIHNIGFIFEKVIN